MLHIQAPTFTNFYAICSLLAVTPCLGPGATKANPPVAASVEAQLARLPLAFEPNQGQARPGYDFLARGQGYDLLLSRREVAIGLKPVKSSKASRLQRTVRLRLDGEHDGPDARGLEALPGKVNYFLGNNPKRWRTDIPTFARIAYDEVYPGVQLIYYGSQGTIEYDFVIRPGADPSPIRMSIEGSERLNIDTGGNLEIGTALEPVRIKRPVAYQEVGRTRHAVDCRFLLSDAREVRFALGAYDHRKPLVIDPTLVYSTRLGGGSSNDFSNARSIAVDANGSAYVAGSTYAMDFPLVNPEQSISPISSAIFISKLSPGGAGLVYSTLLGGSNSDYPNSIAVDSNGRATVVGSTTSADFPLHKALYGTLAAYDTDAFVTRLNATGNGLVYSTYLGGSQYDYATGVAVDSSSNAYVAGYTCSTDFPTMAASYQPAHTGGCDGFVTKINATGSAEVYSTYFGNNFSVSVFGIAVGSGATNLGVAYLAGSVCGGSFPVTQGAAQLAPGGSCDAFVASLNAGGSGLAYATFLGGSQIDYATSIAADTNGNAYVTGFTLSPDLPFTAGSLQPTLAGAYDAFVAKLNATGSQFLYATYLGGLHVESANGIAVDAAGNAIVTGYTNSHDFKVQAALQPAFGGNGFTLLKTSTSGSSWHGSDSGFADLATAVSYDTAAPTHIFAIGQIGTCQSINGGGSWTPLSGNGLPKPGYFSGLARAPSNSNTMYVSQPFGPVYVSQDGGANWTLVANPPPTLPYGLRVDPTSPATIYTFSQASPTGISRSVDGGGTWTQLATPGSSTNQILDLAIHPTSPLVLYAATSSGLYISKSGGLGWSPLNVGTLVSPYNATQVILSPANPAVVYVNTSNQIWKSTDGGKTWAALSGINTVTNLAIAPSKPTTLYAVTYGSFGSDVYISPNGGGSWTLATTGLQGAQITSIAVNPVNPAVALAIGFPTTNAFVAKVNSTGTGLVYSTYLGGSSFDYGYGVATNASGNAFVVGSGDSLEFPTTPAAFQHSTGQYANTTFVARIKDATAACSNIPVPDSQFFYGYGGTAGFSVVSPSGCPWTASTTDSWITIIRTHALGTGGVDISVASNPGTARTGSITTGTGVITINQAAGGCGYLLDNYNLTFPQTGGSLNVNVTAGPGCDWNVTNLPLWLTVTSGATGSGNGTVMLQAAPNLFAGPRTGLLYIAANYPSVSEAGTSAAASPAREPAEPTVPQPPFLLPGLFDPRNPQCALQPWLCQVPGPRP